VLERRDLFRGAAALTIGTLAGSAFAQEKPEGDPKGTTPPPRDWNDPATTPYPDAAFEVFDKRFGAYNAGTTSLRRISTGGVWTEGPVWFGDSHRLIWSDIPKNQLVEYNVMTGQQNVFREPSNYANGNTRDWEGRLLSAEQGTRRVTRTEYDGSITVIADKFEGKPLNSPNGVVVKKDDGSIWFTDPPTASRATTKAIRKSRSFRATSIASIRRRPKSPWSPVTSACRMASASRPI
jgi:SMP-30/Gluconolactonase/LRE-like region